MKHDVSNIIKQADERGIHIKDIVGTGLVSQATLYRASIGAMVSAKTRNSITRAIAMCSQEADDVAFNQGHEVSTEQLAANLEKQVDALRDTITGSGLVDDAIESAHSREKAELQKALAARINEVQNLAADVAYEREKGLDTLNQLLRAEDMLKDERVKNKTQAESIGQCLDEIDRLKRLVALRTQDLAVYQKELEAADNRADKAECGLIMILLAALVYVIFGGA